MNAWEIWKKGFDAWEGATASFLEKALSSPLVLAPAGTMLTATMKTKSAWDRALSDAWGRAGLATRRDVERALHTLNRLESKLLDLEESLDETSRNSTQTSRKSSPRPRS